MTPKSKLGDINSPTPDPEDTDKDTGTDRDHRTVTPTPEDVKDEAADGDDTPSD